MSVLNPPLFMQVRYSSVINLAAVNQYQVSLIVSTQNYVTGSYNGLTIVPDLWVTSGSSGYIFRINSIITTSSPSTPTPTSVVLIIEDVNGYNKKIGIGAPIINSYGYIYQLNTFGVPTSSHIISLISGYNQTDNKSSFILVPSSRDNNNSFQIPLYTSNFSSNIGTWNFDSEYSLTLTFSSNYTLTNIPHCDGYLLCYSQPDGNSEFDGTGSWATFKISDILPTTSGNGGGTFNNKFNYNNISNSWTFNIELSGNDCFTNPINTTIGNFPGTYGFIIALNL